MQFEKEYWNNRYASGGNSGYGSYDGQLKKKLKWLSGLDIKSITEFGCGDFHFGKKLLKLYPGVSYVGMDVSDYITEKNREENPQYSFMSTEDGIPQADLLLCVDVLFHVIDENEAENILKRLSMSWTKYLAITAYERDEKLNSGHVRIRRFDPSIFGTPIIRKVVEKDGDLYFYLFKKDNDFNYKNCTACLITKNRTYPEEILKEVSKYPFGEISILTSCDSPHRKQELFAKAKYPWIYYQDDDCIAPIEELAKHVKWGVNCAMKTVSLNSYRNSRIALLGWGSFFPKEVINVLDVYRKKYGEDFYYKRETERIMTYLSFDKYPQNRVDLPIHDLPWAMASDRLSMQPDHYSYIQKVEDLCAPLIEKID